MINPDPPVIEIVPDDSDARIDLDEDELDTWPADGNELMVRLMNWWAESTWLMV